MVLAPPRPCMTESASVKCNILTEATWDKVNPDAPMDLKECKAFNSSYYAADDVAQFYVHKQYHAGCPAAYSPKKDIDSFCFCLPDYSNEGRSCPHNGTKASGTYVGNGTSVQQSHGRENSRLQPSGSNGGGFGSSGDGDGQDPDRWQKPLPRDADDFVAEDNDSDQNDDVQAGLSDEYNHGQAGMKRSNNAVEASTSMLEPEPKQARFNYIDNPDDDRNGTERGREQSTSLPIGSNPNDVPSSSTNPRSPSHTHPESHPQSSPVRESLLTELDPLPAPQQNNQQAHLKLKATVCNESNDIQPGTAATGQPSAVCLIDNASEQKEVSNEENQMTEYHLNPILPSDVEMSEIQKPLDDSRTHNETGLGDAVDFSYMELCHGLYTSSSDDDDEACTVEEAIIPEARMTAVGNRYHDVMLSSDDEMEDRPSTNAEIKEQNSRWDPGKRSMSHGGVRAAQDNDDDKMDCQDDRPGSSGLQTSRQTQDRTQRFTAISAPSTARIPAPSSPPRLDGLAGGPRISPVSSPTTNDPPWRQLVGNQPPPERRVARHCDSCAEDIVTDSGEFGVSGTFTCGRCVQNEINEVRVNMMRGSPRRERVFYDPPAYLFQLGPDNRAFVQHHVDRRVRRSCNYCPTEVWTSDPLYCPNCGKFFCHPACLDQHLCRNRTFR